MTIYHAKSNNTLTFEVTKEESLIGKLTYQSWFKFNAVIELADNTMYQVEPKGFWGTTVELKDGDKVLAKFKMNWYGEIVVQTFWNGLEEGYLFKHRGLFKESFVLTNEEGLEMIVLKPLLKWTKMHYEYQVTTSDGLEGATRKDLLLMASLHCANYYMSMMMAQ